MNVTPDHQSRNPGCLFFQIELLFDLSPGVIVYKLVKLFQITSL